MYVPDAIFSGFWKSGNKFLFNLEISDNLLPFKITFTSVYLHTVSEKLKYNQCSTFFSSLTSALLLINTIIFMMLGVDVKKVKLI